MLLLPPLLFVHNCPSICLSAPPISFQPIAFLSKWADMVFLSLLGWENDWHTAYEMGILFGPLWESCGSSALSLLYICLIPEYSDIWVSCQKKVAWPPGRALFSPPLTNPLRQLVSCVSPLRWKEVANILPTTKLKLSPQCIICYEAETKYARWKTCRCGQTKNCGKVNRVLRQARNRFDTRIKYRSNSKLYWMSSLHTFEFEHNVSIQRGVAWVHYYHELHLVEP